jgi:hypothetical protein
MHARSRRRRWTARSARAGTVSLLAGLALGVCLGRNWRSLREGLRYLCQWLAWDPGQVTPVAPDGDFGVCYELARLDNTARQALIADWLRELGLVPDLIPIPGETLPNLLVRFHARGPYSLFVTHYDKSRETASYQAASDNTAAVAVLLAAARDLAHSPPRRPLALLFTAAEERGLKGARAFMGWAAAQPWTVGEVINLDMLGRGRLASRPSALPGFYFWLPGLGELAFDGRKVRRGRAYPLPDARLVADLKAALGDELVSYRRFTARSDSNVFQEAGLPTVSLSSDNMYYLDRVWERDADRVDLLDEDHLNLARRLVVGYARRAHTFPKAPSFREGSER